jgi:ketosteroid isomerase-like protein
LTVRCFQNDRPPDRAFNNADVDTLREVFADTTVFHEPGRSPISGDYEGLDQVLGFFGTLVERSGGTFRATLHDVVANDDHAIGLHSSDAERDGRAVRSPTVLVFHVRDGRLAETWSHHYDQQEFDEFWAWVVISATVGGCAQNMVGHIGPLAPCMPYTAYSHGHCCS